MLELDEDALVCDFAETYHIYDYRSLPLKMVATLSVGLRENSRIKMAASGLHVSQDTLLLATIADRVELFRYGFTEAAKSGKKPPAMLVDTLVGEANKKQSGAERFRTASEFEAARAKLVEKVRGKDNGRNNIGDGIRPDSTVGAGD